MVSRKWMEGSSIGQIQLASYMQKGTSLNSASEVESVELLILLITIWALLGIFIVSTFSLSFLFLYLSILMYLCLSHLSLYLFQIWPLFFGIVELQLSGNANLIGWQSSTKSGNCVSFFSVVNAEKQITVVSQMKDNLYKGKMIKMWRKADKKIQSLVGRTIDRKTICKNWKCFKCEQMQGNVS
jgi:hypothetical protein